MAHVPVAAVEYAKVNEARFLSQLKALIRIPSVSTNPENERDMQHAADWLASDMRAIGLENVRICPTAKHPVVYGDYLHAGDDLPTVLIYGHYDVQPAEPLDLWASNAFEPEQRGDNLYGRGATDMKGQVMASLKAVEALIVSGDLRANVKFILEGEEEIGSPSLRTFIAQNKDLLACDFALNPDAGMLAPDLPTITYALRGLAYFEINLTGPAQDLHSGLFGGVIHNPAQVLCELVAGMHDEDGRVTLPGFYDKVLGLDDDERQDLARLPIDDEFYKHQAGVTALWGERGYTAVERVGARPTLEVNGLLSGFTGEGSKTVLPAKAMVKISCRLVPNQDPQDVRQQLEQYMAEHAPDTVHYEIKGLASNKASLSDRHSRWVQAMQASLATVWGVEPIFRREGGSIPVVEMFQHVLGVESVNIGFALPEDNMHAPNEKIHLPTWRRGVEAITRFLGSFD